MKAAQLPLNLSLRDSSCFANFVAGVNAEVAAQVRAAAEGTARERGVFLWGETGTGKSHLLQSACRHAQERGAPCAYVSFAAVEDASLAVLDDRDEGLVCLDDLDRIAGRTAWERSVFAVYERLRAYGGALLAAARRNPASLGLAMPELVTRLGAGPVYQLHGLRDEDRVEALCLRAHNRGLEMERGVARYVMNRYPRDLDALFALLDRLDRASLARQRRITIPFIRSLD